MNPVIITEEKGANLLNSVLPNKAGKSEVNAVNIVPAKTPKKHIEFLL